MGSATVTGGFLDTFVAQDNPLANYNLGGSMYVRQWSGDIRVGYLYFPNPVPPGVTITSAKIHLYGYAKPVSGTIQLYLRRLNQTISMTKVNWNTRATSFSYPEVYSSKSGTYPDWTEYVFDAAALFQPIADGTARWYGLQLGSDWTSTGWSPRFMAANHPNPDLRPWAEFTWSDTPDEPTQLSPSAGRVISTAKPILRFNFTDVSGDTDLAKAQVQVHTSTTFTSPLYDSGAQPVDTPQWDLTPTAFTATAGTTYYWRVRVQDGAGLWSGWSAAASFVYRALPTVAIDAPALPPNNYVEEPTPPITWTTTGTQESYQLGIWRLDGTKWVNVYARPRTVSAITDGFVVPAGVITVKNATYRVDVRVYDDYDREAIPNGPAYAQLSREFTYQFSAATTPVSALAADPQDPYPGIKLTWTRATMPDSYSIIRDGEIIAAGLDPDDDTHVGGTSYAWTDLSPVKRQAHTYSVQPIVNGKASTANPEVTATNRILGTWIVDAYDPDRRIMLVQDKDREFTLEGDSAVYKVLGATNVSLVTQTLRAYSGSVNGELMSGFITETADELQANLMLIKGSPGRLVYLFITSMTIPVVLDNIQCSPSVRPQRSFLVSFEFHEQGRAPFTPVGLA